MLSGASDDNPHLVTDVLVNHGTGFILKGTKVKVFEHALAMTVDGGVFIPEEILRAIAPRSILAHQSQTLRRLNRTSRPEKPRSPRCSSRA